MNDLCDMIDLVTTLRYLVRASCRMKVRSIIGALLPHLCTDKSWQTSTHNAAPPIAPNEPQLKLTSRDDGWTCVLHNISKIAPGIVAGQTAVWCHLNQSYLQCMMGLPSLQDQVSWEEAYNHPGLRSCKSLKVGQCLWATSSRFSTLLGFKGSAAHNHAWRLVWATAPPQAWDMISNPRRDSTSASSSQQYSLSNTSVTF